MANLLLNNKSNAIDYILFDSIPNIITVESATTSQSKAKYEFNFNNTNLSSIVEDAVIEVNGFQVQATNDLQSARGRKFFIPTTKEALAINVMNALKNIPNLAMLYDFYHFNGTTTFNMIAKGYGSQYNIAVRFNAALIETDATNITLSTFSGGLTNELYGQDSSKIYLDIYSLKGLSQKALLSTTNVDFTNMVYTTTLEKEFYEDRTNFDISPILTTLSENGKLTSFRINAYCIKDGNYQYIGTTNTNYVTRGYLVNQGNKYIDFKGEGFVTYMPALNVKKGTNETSYNKSTLYVYQPSIPLTLYYATGSISYTIKYLASDETVLFQQTISPTATTPSSNVKDITINLDNEKLRESFYIDLQFDFGTLRYNVINPPYGNSDCTRVYWYNSYGGISFFDFTGEKQEERKSSSTTYNKSLLDYYYEESEEQKIVYNKDIELTTKLTSHLMDKNGSYQLYDLQDSYKAWIDIEGRRHYIIVSEVSLEEPQDNIYRATIKYTYSLIDSFN